MDNALVRIMGIRITNLKNVSSGEISFTNDQENSNANMLGLFGQNGSGKTSFIEALSILKGLMAGASVPSVYADCVAVGKDFAKLEFVFSSLEDQSHVVPTLDRFDALSGLPTEIEAR